ncbi:translesion error-prone DNA polymerase V autoproteolytic subunit [Salinicola sp. JS01]|uniref:LexA family protein n=1 Tax=Salinicola sp. JS01 TaxID=3050071 RepID=UPI00255B7A28|nr:translesion error-prone DNA polymerase V autoproteolytic subunit [Salinicola sp. JS01]WIX34164.1 translesion error-prone DNA polymerase V autoproteolytic subunit [Salinicola sp. JS01]
MTIPVEYLGSQRQSTQPVLIPIAASEARAGFPSPADDYMETELDLIAHIVQRPSSTFYVRAAGDSMERHGIFDGDILVVDRSLEPVDGDTLIIAVDGEITCKRLGKIGQRPYLLAGNEAYKPIPLANADCHVWGVVTHNVHSLRRGR